MNIVKSKQRLVLSREAVGVILVTIIGFVYRLYQNTYGLPSVSHEEYVTLGRAWQMSQSGNLNPGWFSWPSLLIYIELCLRKLLLFFGAREWNDFVLIARSFQAFIGSLTIGLVYLITILYTKNKRVGLLTAVLVAILPPHVYYSRLSRPEVLVPFFFLLAAFFAWYILKTGSLRYYILSGIACGLAIAVKYNGIFTLCIPISAHVLYSRRNHGSLTKIWFPLSVFFVSLIVFLVTNPYAIMDSNTFITGLTYQKGRIEFDILNHLAITVKIFAKAMGIPTLSLAILGVFCAIKRHKNEDLFILISLFSSVLLIGLWNPSTRLLLSGVLFSIIIASRALIVLQQRIIRRIPKQVRTIIYFILIAVIVVYSLYENVRQTQELSGVSVTEAMNNVLFTQVPVGSNIYWGYEAPIPFYTKNGRSLYVLSGDNEPHITYGNDIASFFIEHYGVVILTGDHRKFLGDPSLDQAANDFYNQLYRNATVYVFTWERGSNQSYSAPYSQIFRDDEQLHGEVYILLYHGNKNPG